jgi:hypothetical protein
MVPGHRFQCAPHQWSTNLSMHAEDYTGTNQIRVGNGQGLNILHSGPGILPTPSHKFHLFSLLDVP